MLAKQHNMTFKSYSAKMESKKVTSAAPSLHPIQTGDAKNIYKFREE